MASSAPRGLRSDHVVTVGIALFSMLFGAGNLIIPPLLALQAGSATPVAMLGFLIAAIGRPRAHRPNRIGRGRCRGLAAGSRCRATGSL